MNIADVHILFVLSPVLLGHISLDSFYYIASILWEWAFFNHANSNNEFQVTKHSWLYF